MKKHFRKYIVLYGIAGLIIWGLLVVGMRFAVNTIVDESLETWIAERVMPGDLHPNLEVIAISQHQLDEFEGGGSGQVHFIKAAISEGDLAEVLSDLEVTLYDGQTNCRPVWGGGGVSATLLEDEDIEWWPEEIDLDHFYCGRFDEGQELFIQADPEQNIVYINMEIPSLSYEEP